MRFVGRGGRNQGLPRAFLMDKKELWLTTQSPGVDLANAPYSKIRVVTFWVWVWLVTKVPGAGLPVGVMVLLGVQLDGTI